MPFTSGTTCPDPTAPTLAEFSQRFLADCAHHWKPATRIAHAQNIKNQILPTLGNHRLSALSRRHVAEWASALPCAPATQARALAVLSLIMRHAEVVGLRAPGTNPCAGLRRRKTEFVATYLDAGGYAALAQCLTREAMRFPRAAPFVQFLALTGCRRAEALGARWDQITANSLVLPDSKSGPKTIWLGRPVLQLLSALPHLGETIFAAGDPAGLETELKSLWQIVRHDLNMPRLRLHDLRHSYASMGVRIGLDLRLIGGLLGHADLGSTAGYAHLDRKDLTAASARIGQHLERASKAKPRKPKHRDPTENDMHRFLELGIPLDRFCAANGLSATAFKRRLQRWYRAERMAPRGAA